MKNHLVRRKRFILVLLAMVGGFHQGPAAWAQTPRAALAPEALKGYERSVDLTAEDWVKLLGRSGAPSGGASARSGAAIFDSVARRVAFIYCKGNGSSGLGTGSVISSSGLILTNHHVIEGAKLVYVFLYPGAGKSSNIGHAYLARVVRLDQQRDLALLKLAEQPSSLVPIQFGVREKIKVGDQVHAIGHPRGQEWSYTQGYISQLRDNFDWSDGDYLHKANVIQTQTPINPGNSGGPLLDAQGRMVGVNTFVDPKSQGLNFAVSIDEVVDFLKTSENRMARKAPKKDKTTVAGGGECQIKVLSTYRNSKNDANFADADLNCDGKVDATWREPDDKSLGIRLTFESQGDGRTDKVFVDDDRDGKWDYSLHDTDGDGVPDSIGLHPDGELTPVRYRPYAGEADLREMLRREKTARRI